MGRLQRLFNNLIGLQLSSHVGRQAMATDFKEQWIISRHGYKLYTHLHYPVKSGFWPAILVVPGGLSAGTDYDKGDEITITDIASHGFVVLHYDPSGRGRSEGEENYWGEKQQDEFFDMLQILHDCSLINPEQIGVLSFSIGNAIAIGGLARHQPSFVRYLFDWEGPSNRFNITKNDSHPPLQDFPGSDLNFWFQREPRNFIANLPCGYFRYQAMYDHMQGKNKSHAMELITMASHRCASWTQLNSNTINIEFDEGRLDNSYWIPPWHNHKGQILKYLLEIIRK